jgi:hypothetical protein
MKTNLIIEYILKFYNFRRSDDDDVVNHHQGGARPRRRRQVRPQQRDSRDRSRILRRM